jgi:N-formylglutamate amidohydrolase
VELHKSIVRLIGTAIFNGFAQEINRPERSKKVYPAREAMSVTRQPTLLALPRSATSLKPTPVNATNLELMRLIDHRHLKRPFLRSP